MMIVSMMIRTTLVSITQSMRHAMYVISIVWHMPIVIHVSIVSITLAMMIASMMIEVSMMMIASMMIE